MAGQENWWTARLAALKAAMADNHLDFETEILSSEPLEPESWDDPDPDTESAGQENWWTPRLAALKAAIADNHLDFETESQSSEPLEPEPWDVPDFDIESDSPPGPSESDSDEPDFPDAESLVDAAFEELDGLGMLLEQVTHAGLLEQPDGEDTGSEG